ncbi:MAG: hypothetical protein AAF711_00090 [Planctomycetota bacterium]
MKLFFTILIILLLASNSALAETPDLTGTWRVESGFLRTHAGETIDFSEASDAFMTITDQEGPVFSGNYGWRHPDTMQDLHDGETTTNEANEAFVGVVHFDGQTITIADHPDSTVYIGRLVEENRMELIAYESGANAFASRAIMIREE